MNIISSSPRNADQSQDNSWIGSSNLQVISKQILEVLNVDDQWTVQEHQNIIFSLIQELQKEIERIQNELGYDYDEYEARLAIDDKILEETFQSKVLWDANLKRIYESLLWRVEYEPTKELLKQRLWSEYFEGLVYESIEPSQIKWSNLDLSRWRLKTRLRKNKTGFLKDLRNVNSIQLWGNHLNKFDEASLTVIFENLKNVKSIDVTGNDLDEIDETRLKIIFENFKNLNSIKLSANYLNKFDEARLRIIFGNLRNVKSIYLWWNYLNELNETKLTVVFRNLRMVKSIDLRENYLNQLDENRLKIIFGNLWNAQKIYLTEPPEFIEKLLLLFPNLKWKIINQE